MLRTMFVNAVPALRKRPIVFVLLAASSTFSAAPAFAQTPKNANGKQAADARPTRATLLRGEYGPYRANNDLLYYHLDVRVDPEKQTISGKNTIRFRMLKDDARIQLDLQPALAVDKILFGDDAAQVREGIRRRLRRLSRDVEGGSGLFHRLPLLGQAGLGRAVRRLRLPQGPGRPPLDLHVVRDAGCQRLVAQQGPVARRGRVDGLERHDSQRPRGRLQRQARSARRTSATATRAGTGT